MLKKAWLKYRNLPCNGRAKVQDAGARNSLWMNDVIFIWLTAYDKNLLTIAALKNSQNIWLCASSGIVQRIRGYFYNEMRYINLRFTYFYLL